MQPMTAAQIFEMMKTGKAAYSVARNTKSFVFYSVAVPGRDRAETIRVHISEAI